MSIWVYVISGIVGVGNIAFWWWAMTRGEARFRAWVERRYRVTITRGPKSHWIVEGEGSWWRRGAISWLQLVYIMGIFVLWGIAIGLVVFVQQKFV